MVSLRNQFVEERQFGKVENVAKLIFSYGGCTSDNEMVKALDKKYDALLDKLALEALKKQMSMYLNVLLGLRGFTTKRRFCKCFYLTTEKITWLKVCSGVKRLRSPPLWRKFWNFNPLDWLECTPNFRTTVLNCGNEHGIYQYIIIYEMVMFRPLRPIDLIK